MSTLPRMTIPEPRLPLKPAKVAALVVMAAVGAWFLTEELIYSLTRSRANEPMARTVALIVHLAFAVPLLLLPPLQFSRRVRIRWPQWHRRAGVLFLVSAIIASSLAIYLGITFRLVGRRVPVVLFAILWLIFSIVAWIAARRRSFRTHEQFVVRSYTIAFAFVVVRTLGVAEDVLFGFIPQGELRGATREWLCFVLPLLLVEAWYNWWPSMRQLRTLSAPSRRSDQLR